MKNDTFFSDQKEQSKIKTAILTKYFSAWSTILKTRTRSGRIAYVDLFSGPGKYEDGRDSTPLIILKKCIENPDLQEKIVTIFNDKTYSENLITNIKGLPGINKLKYQPQILSTEVGDELAEVFEKKSLIPTLAFVDPWGYKGLTTKLIKALIKDFGSDCIFFFNYNRINMGINNNIVKEHMDALFGEDRADVMRKSLKAMAKEEKELYIVNELGQSLSDNGLNYVLPFRFLDENKNKTSHYLIFVSKHPLGYSIMKDIMAKESTLDDDGVCSFSYIPVKHIKKYTDVQLSLLSAYERPLDSLGNDLLETFRGKKRSVRNIFETHHVGTPFVLANYKEALRRLEDDKKIIVDPPAHKRKMRKGIRTMGDKVSITFPR
jgi:three-Cys-motif partner protein